VFRFDAGGWDFKNDKTFRAILGFDLCVILAGVANSFYDPGSPMEPFSEWGFATILSACQLLFIGLLSLEVFRIRRKGNGAGENSRYIWIIMGLGFIFFALDELFEFHEEFDHLIHEWFELEETGLTDRFDDLILAFYLIIGLYLLHVSREEIMKFKVAFSPIPFTIPIVIVMLIVDAVANRKDILSYFIHDEDWCYWVFIGFNIFEEALKMLAEGMVLGIGFHCRKLAIEWQTNPGSSVEPERGDEENEDKGGDEENEDKGGDGEIEVTKGDKEQVVTKIDKLRSRSEGEGDSVGVESQQQSEGNGQEIEGEENS